MAVRQKIAITQIHLAHLHSTSLTVQTYLLYLPYTPPMANYCSSISRFSHYPPHSFCCPCVLPTVLSLRSTSLLSSHCTILYHASLSFTFAAILAQLIMCVLPSHSQPWQHTPTVMTQHPLLRMLSLLPPLPPAPFPPPMISILWRAQLLPLPTLLRGGLRLCSTESTPKNQHPFWTATKINFSRRFEGSCGGAWRAAAYTPG